MPQVLANPRQVYYNKDDNDKVVPVLTDSQDKRWRNMVRACIFDLDGTIADTVESIAHAGNKVLQEFGLTPRPVEAYNYYAGDGIDLTLKRALVDAGDAEASLWEQGIPLIRSYFAEEPMYHVKPFKGMPEALQQLKSQGILLGVCTNKPHEEAVRVVETLYGKGTFDRIQGQIREIPIKPAPDGAWKIAEEFQVRPEECMYFGDTDTDMKTGRAAGMYTVGVTWGFRPREELEENHAMALIERPQEIPELVREHGA